MRNSGPKEMRGALERRRREVRQILAVGIGAVQFPRGTELQHDGYVVRLRDLLVSLGPVFATFGRYLASRPDLMCLPDCIALSATRDIASATPYELVQQIVQTELDRCGEGTDRTQHFVRFDPEPFESRLLCQLHYGELQNGDLVVVKLIHPELQLDLELRLLPMLVGVVSPILSDPELFGLLIEDFQRSIGEATDCRRVAESLESLSHDSRESDLLTVPKVHRHLCSRNILITERLDGIRLDRYIARCKQESLTFDSSSAVDGYIPDEIARQIVDIWLTQAFNGTMMPVEICPENILIRSASEFAIVDGTFITLPRASKGSLLNYFCANAADEPSKALTELLKELDATHRRVSEATLDRQFRQVVAFRDGGWEDGGRANCLSETLFAQWRLASKQGFRPLSHLAQTYRGTYHIAWLARQLSTQRDSFEEGVKDLRLTKLLHDISTMIQPSYWGGQADRIGAMLVLGPKFLDDALKSISEKVEMKHASNNRTRSTNYLLSVLVLVVLVSTALLLFREGIDLAFVPGWFEKVSAVAFVVVGWLLIRVLKSSSDVG